MNLKKIFNYKKCNIFSPSILYLFIFFSFTAFSQVFDEQVFKLIKFFDWVDNHYVDSVNKSMLIETALNSMLQKMDPHSTYLNFQETKVLTESLQGSFEGVGMVYEMLHDTMLVIHTIAGGPCEKAGIEPGDCIVKIDNRNITGLHFTKKYLTSMIKGTKGTTVIMTVKKYGTNHLIDYSIVRDNIKINSVDAAYMVDNETGYVKFNKFALTTGDEFKEVFNQLHKSGMKNIIIDLTNNGGGYLEEAVYVAGQFLDSNKMIVYTKGLHLDQQDYRCAPGGFFTQGMVVIMIDENSASASEIVAGAIQDWDRGLIVGRRSFGKGLVQRPFYFSDGSMVRLTVARYYTPSGRQIQKPYQSYIDYNNDLLLRLQHGELTNKDSIHFPDSLKYKTLLLNRTVYGAGGIMPDIFVPEDTSESKKILNRLIQNGEIYKYALIYANNNRKSLQSQYVTFKDFDDHFHVSQHMNDEFLVMNNQDNKVVNNAQFYANLSLIDQIMKAYIARLIWGLNEYYQIFNLLNPIYLKAKQSVKIKPY